MMQIAFNLPPLLAQDEPAGDWLFWIIAAVAIIISVVRYLAQQKAEQRQRQARKAPPPAGKPAPQPQPQLQKPPRPAPGPRPSAPAPPPVQLHEKLRRIEEARRRARQAPPPVPVVPVVEPEIVLQPVRQPVAQPVAQPPPRKAKRPAAKRPTKVQYVSKEEMLRQARAKQGVQLQKMLQNLPTGMSSYGGDSGGGGRVNIKKLGLRSRSDLARAILLREVLGPPKALQGDEPL